MSTSQIKIHLKCMEVALQTSWGSYFSTAFFSQSSQLINICVNNHSDLEASLLVIMPSWQCAKPTTLKPSVLITVSWLHIRTEFSFLWFSCCPQLFLIDTSIYCLFDQRCLISTAKGTSNTALLLHIFIKHHELLNFKSQNY